MPVKFVLAPPSKVILPALMLTIPPFPEESVLALIEEQPYQEIADALGISVGAVKLRVFRATRLLRKELKEMGIEP